jgi:hypothetical protein
LIWLKTAGRRFSADISFVAAGYGLIWLKTAGRRFSADISFVAAGKKRGFCRLRLGGAQVLQAD